MKALSTKILVALLGLALSASSAGAGAEFLAFGYADYEPAVDQVDAVVEVYGILAEAGGMEPPIPLDFVNYEHTLVITGWVVASVSQPIPTVRLVDHNGGTVRIYSDPIAGGTAADYANRGTFTDGTKILEGTLADGFALVLSDNYGGSADGLIDSGSGSGPMTWTGGSRFGYLTGIGYDPAEWDVFAQAVADAGSGAPPGVSVPASFDRVFDVKIVPRQGVANEGAAWSEVKRLYR